MAGRTGVASVSGDRLRQARTNAGYRTQADLAAALGWRGKGALAHYESGTRRPDVHTLYRLAAQLHVDVIDLLQPGTPLTLEILRIRTGRTQAEFAERLGISRELWSAIETGRRALAPDEDLFQSAATELGVDAAGLIAAAGTTPDTTPMVVPIPADIAARVDRIRLPGEAWEDALRRLLRPEQ